MTSRDIAIKTLEGLPDSATWDDIEERVRLLAAIHKGLAAFEPPRLSPPAPRNEAGPQ